MLVCLGDSITQNAQGYCAQLHALITAAYPERGIRVVNAGISGNKIGDLLARLDRDVLAHRPNWVSVNVGINDVWHGLRPGGTGTPLPDYRAGLETLVDRLLAAGTNTVLLPPTVIEEDLESEGNRLLASYRSAMRQIGQVRGCLIAPTDTDFDRAIRAGRAASGAGFALTSDGVHMKPAGDAVMVLAVCKTLHFLGMA